MLLLPETILWGDPEALELEEDTEAEADAEPDPEAELFENVEV